MGPDAFECDAMAFIVVSFELGRDGSFMVF